MECITWSIIIYKYRRSYSIRRTAYLRALGATPTRAPLREALKKAVRAAEAANMMLVDAFFRSFCGGEGYRREESRKVDDQMSTILTPA